MRVGHTYADAFPDVAQVICVAGELLNQAEELIRDGLHPSEIVQGYEKAAVKVRSEAVRALRQELPPARLGVLQLP